MKLWHHPPRNKSILLYILHALSSVFMKYITDPSLPVLQICSRNPRPNPLHPCASVYVWVVPLCLCMWSMVFKLLAFRGPLFPTPSTIYICNTIDSPLQSSTPLHWTTQHNGLPAQNHSALHCQYLHYHFSQQNKHRENWMDMGNITFKWADEMGAVMMGKRSREWLRWREVIMSVRLKDKRAEQQIKLTFPAILFFCFVMFFSN